MKNKTELKPVNRTFAFKTVGMILWDFKEELERHYESIGVAPESRTFLTRSTFRRLAKKLGFPLFEEGEWRRYSLEEYEEIMQKLREYYRIA